MKIRLRDVVYETGLNQTSRIKSRLRFTSGGVIRAAWIAGFVIQLSSLFPVAHAQQPGTIATVAGDKNTYTVGSITAAPTEFDMQPNMLAFDSKGNLYIADDDGILRLTPEGKLQAWAGFGKYVRESFEAIKDGQSAIGMRFPFISGMAVDSSDNVFISDYNRHQILKITPDQRVWRFAGTNTGFQDGSTTGNAGFSGDGGPAPEARFWLPGGLAFDRSGNLYVADEWNERIRRIDKNGIITTVAGSGPGTVVDPKTKNLVISPGYSGDGGPATSARLNGPTSITLDPEGNLYIADDGNFRIRKVDTHGTITSFAGNTPLPSTFRDRFKEIIGGYSGDGGPAAQANLSHPRSIAYGNGQLYVSDSYGNRIRAIGTDGIIRSVAGVSPPDTPGGYSGDGDAALLAEISQPDSIAVSASGSVYFTDQGNTVVRAMDSTGIISTAAGTGSYSGNNTIEFKLSSGFNYPDGTGLDRMGNVYIADLENHAVMKLSSAGELTRFAGTGENDTDTEGNHLPRLSGEGIPATSAVIWTPSRVAADLQGNLYISDHWSHRVRKVTPDGKINTVAGSGPVSVDEETLTTTGGYDGDGKLATKSLLNVPNGLAVDSLGVLYIADAGNLRIRKVTLDGIISTIAGDGSVPTSATANEGGVAAQTRVNPSDLALDNQGNLFFTDLSLSQVRKIDPQGRVTTVAGVGPFEVAEGTGREILPIADEGVSAKVEQLYFPRGIAVDSAGNLFIGDSDNWRIRKVDPQGIITTIAGRQPQHVPVIDPAFPPKGYVAEYLGEGGPAIAANITSPRAPVIDASGNVMFLATGKNLLLKVYAVAAPGVVAGAALGSVAGDVNGNGKADLADVIRALQEAVGQITLAEEEIKRADLNGDGKLDLRDVTLLLRKVVGL